MNFLGKVYKLTTPSADDLTTWLSSLNEAIVIANTVSIRLSSITSEIPPIEMLI